MAAGHEADSQVLLEEEDSQVWVWPEKEEDICAVSDDNDILPTQQDPATQALPNESSAIACDPEAAKLKEAIELPPTPKKAKCFEQDAIKWVEGVPYVQSHTNGHIYAGRCQMILESSFHKKQVKCMTCSCSTASKEEHGCSCLCHPLQKHYDAKAAVPASWATQTI